jgi:hypothetical protein
MTVSNEDREAAIQMILETKCVFDNPETPYLPVAKEAYMITDAYIAHGWGPRPAVDATRLAEMVGNRSHACPKDHAGEEVWVVHPEDVVEIVRECGIEVTE